VQKLSREYFELHHPKGQPWLEAKGVPGADPATYKPLNHCWCVDAQHVYFEGARVKDADVGSFVVLNELFAKDRNNVYSKHGVARIHDPATFEVLDDGYFVDEALGNIYAGYARDRQAVYYADENWGSETKAIRSADPQSFVNLNTRYAKDARRVYHGGRPISGAKPEQFRFFNDGYTRGAKHVYYFGHRLEEANPDAFEIIERYLARDDKHVYDVGHIIAGADPRTFRRLNEDIATDAHLVFVCNEAQPHIDIASFELIGYDYFADKNGVYWQGKLIADADRGTFRALDYGRAKDRSAEYKDDQPPRRPGGRAAPKPVPKPEPVEDDDDDDDLSDLLDDAEEESTTVLVAESDAQTFTDPNVTATPDRDADLELLAKTLAAGDTQAFELAMRAARDPEAEEPLVALLEVYEQRQLAGMIDWRSDTEETISQIEAMLWRMGIRDFDWTFVDVLIERGDGTELRNNNFLSLLRDGLRARGLALVHINLFSDSYELAVLPIAEFAKINGMHAPDEFRICDDFGADESYERGRRILSEAASA